KCPYAEVALKIGFRKSSISIIPAGRKSNISRTALTKAPSSTDPEPNVFIAIDTGSRTPMAYDNWTSQLLASPALTIFLATYLAAYEADRSTLVGSFPLKVTQPCLAVQTLVSTLNFKPV